MNYILCSSRQDQFWKDVASAIVVGRTSVRFVTNDEQLEDEFSKTQRAVSGVLIEAGLRWQSSRLQDFHGFDVAQLLRRQYLIKCPILIISVAGENSFARCTTTRRRHEFLKAGAAQFLSFPFSKQVLLKRISAAKFLTETELRDIVIRHCGLEEEWRQISHKLGGYLSSSDFQERRKEIEDLVNRWEDSITYFAPSSLVSFRKFRRRLNNPSPANAFRSLIQSLQRLDESLHDIGAPLDPARTAEDIPRHPPDGFTRVLIADDEPQNFLITSLQNQYGYDVVQQGFTLSQARELLNREKPDIVLSDLFFKESTRATEVPDKLVGNRFIQSALTHKHYADSNPRKPIVLITSKATLRSETEVRAGAINCSGADRATNPAFIHELIWTEARKRGVVHSENLDPNRGNVEHEWRQRLQQYETDLPRLINQWQKFPETVCETVRLCRLFAKSKGNDEPEFVNEAIRILNPFTFEASFSMEIAESIFKRTDRIRHTTQRSPNSNSKRQILNILHGKIEQCSSAMNAVNSHVKALGEVTDEMAAVPKLRPLASALRHALAEFSKSKRLLPQLTSQNELLRDLITHLPGLTQSSSSSITGKTNVSRVNIVVVEDDEFWRDFASGAIEKVKMRLGEQFEISAQCFDNAEEALKAIPRYSNSFAIAQRHSGGGQTVVIADICLPKNRRHTSRIRAFSNATESELDAPHSKHGFNLIRHLSTYEYDVSLIILSTVNAMADRRMIGRWGVADHDFLAKGINDEDSLVRALIRKIEKRTKHIVKRIQNNLGDSRFLLNGIEIPLSRELGRTLFSLVDLHQTNSDSSFTVTQIIEARGDSQSKQSKKSIHNHILRLRKTIFKTLQRNGVYINVRELLRTEKSLEGDSFRYQLNAEIVPLEDESDYEDDLREYRGDSCRVLIVENDLQIQRKIAAILKQLKYEIAVADTVEEAIRTATKFSPHIVSLDLEIPCSKTIPCTTNFNRGEFAGIEAWQQIRLALRTSSLGIVVPTLNVDKDYLVAQAAQMEIPIRNFVSKREPNWLNLFLKKIANEKQRVYLGEIADASADMSEPVIEILNGSNLLKGILRLAVNGQTFSMKVSPIARIIGLLVSNPKRLLSLNEIKSASGSRGPLTKDDSKNWTKRIRSIVRKNWLSSYEEPNAKSFTRKILESSHKGFQLNAQVIDLRTPPASDIPSSLVK
jgi:CheY-like chemotaxis protein